MIFVLIQDYENTPDNITPIVEPRRPTQQPPGKVNDFFSSSYIPKEKKFIMGIHCTSDI